MTSLASTRLGDIDTGSQEKEVSKFGGSRCIQMLGPDFNVCSLYARKIAFSMAPGFVPFILLQIRTNVC